MDDFNLTRRNTLKGAALSTAAGASACAGDGGFSGQIGVTHAQSTPSFSNRPRPRTGAPNIIVIVLDDVGFSDLGCYGGDIATPAMDALAAGGLRYANFRTTGVCSATRASLLTGLNPHSAGIGWLTVADEGFPGYRGDLAPNAATLPESLSARGYKTYHCGKWHVNAKASVSATGPFDNWPLQRGYQRAYWFQGHSAHYFRPSNMFDGNQATEIDRDDYFVTDDLTDHAIRYLREHVAEASDRPFFLSLAHAAAHSPLHAPRSDISAQRGRYDAGWDRIREMRLARQIELGIVPPNTRLPERNPRIAAWSELSDDQRRLYARYMEVYAAVVSRVDAAIGRLTAALGDLGVRENTLVVLLSDNGGSPDGGLTGTPNLMAGTGGGVNLADALAQIDDIGGPDTYPMYPAGWAMASNTPFRSYKHDTHLGGVADPLILHWPAGIAARGEVRPHYVHVSDVCPTLLSVAGVPPLASRHGAATKPLQGVDFSSTFAHAEAAETRREQHYEMNGTRAFYGDGWRLVSKGRFLQPDDGWELFDLADGCNETVDVAAANPQRVANLERRWMEAAHRCDVFPIDTRSIQEKSFSPLFKGGGRSRWELFPPLDLIPEETAPDLIGRSHTIEFEFAAALQSGDEGVLLAYGNQFLGHALYIRRGQLIHEMACKPRALRTETPAPIGASRITFAHRLTARPWQGMISLSADNRLLVEQRHEPLVFGMAMQGLQIGRNGASPVGRAYARPFAFTGRIRRVTIDLDVTPYNADEVAAALSPRRRT